MRKPCIWLNLLAWAVVAQYEIQRGKGKLWMGDENSNSQMEAPGGSLLPSWLNWISMYCSLTPRSVYLNYPTTFILSKNVSSQVINPPRALLNSLQTSECCERHRCSFTKLPLGDSTGPQVSWNSMLTLTQVWTGDLVR